jgi:hypothetical protein
MVKHRKSDHDPLLNIRYDKTPRLEFRNVDALEIGRAGSHPDLFFGP